MDQGAKSAVGGDGVSGVGDPPGGGKDPAAPPEKPAEVKPAGVCVVLCFLHATTRSASWGGFSAFSYGITLYFTHSFIHLCIYILFDIFYIPIRIF